MTTQPEENVPGLTLGWRLQMALGDMKSQDMADALGVSRSTVARWMHDRGAAPRRAYVLQWAMLTGTSAQWLETGLAGAPSPDGGGSVTSRYADVAMLTSMPRLSLVA